MTALVDNNIPREAARALQELGYTLLVLPPHPALPPSIASHPDMLVFFAPDYIYCTKAYMEVARGPLIMLSARCRKSLRFVTPDLEGVYPRDVRFNGAAVGNHLFGSPKGLDPLLQSHSAYHFAPVKQGYAKCSTVPVGDHALITQDPSIAKTATALGLDVLQVESGGVTLPDYDTGFLGGAASFAPYRPQKEILFCGDLNLHPNGKEIRTFCHRHGAEAVSLTRSPLRDVGTIFLI